MKEFLKALICNPESIKQDHLRT